MADLVRLAASHLEAAHSSDHGSSAELLLRDDPLRQTMIAPVAGPELALLMHLRHAVPALEDSAFLLTTVTGVPSARNPTGAQARGL